MLWDIQKWGNTFGEGGFPHTQSAIEEKMSMLLRQSSS